MRPSNYIGAGVGLTLLTMIVACGVVGAPIAPEDVGVNPTIARQKAQLQKTGAAQPTDNTAAPSTPVEPVESKGQDEELPPLRPVGTR